MSNGLGWDMGRAFTKCISDETVGAKIVTLVEKFNLGDVEYNLVRRIHNNEPKKADHLAFEFCLPVSLEDWRELGPFFIELNLDGDIYRCGGYNSTDNDQCTCVPRTPKYICDQLHITASISLDTLKAICAANQVVVTKSFSASGSGGNLRVQEVFDAYDCAWFWYVCRTFMLEEFDADRVYFKGGCGLFRGRQVKLA
jgi:hypothetical protein